MGYAKKPESRERQRRVQRARDRAMRTLATRHSVEFVRLYNVELEKEGVTDYARIRWGVLQDD